MDDMLNDWMGLLIEYVRSGLPDLTNRQMGLLLIVYHEKGQHTVRGLAQRLSVSKPVITRALNKLDHLGYVRRVPDQNDRRSVFIVQTDQGREFLDRVQQLAERTEVPARPKLMRAV